MRRFYNIAWLSSLVFALALASCSENRGPTSLTEPEFTETGVLKTLQPGTCTTYNELQTLVVTVFGPDDSNNSALSKLRNMQNKVSAPDIVGAQEKALVLIGFITKDRRHALPGTQLQITTLVNKILCYVGLTGSVTNSADVFVISPSTSPQQLITDNGNAGVVIPGGGVTEPTIITIDPIAYASTTPGAGPLHTKLDQYPGYFLISKIAASGSTFTVPVTVAVCPSPGVPSDIRKKLRLGHDASAGFELTPKASGRFLTCPYTSPTTTLRSASTSDGVIDVTRALGEEAFIGGVGGTAVEFSPFGTVDETAAAIGGVGGTAVEFIRTGLQSSLLSSDGWTSLHVDCSKAVIGTAVTPHCRPFVTVKTPLGTVLQNVPVTFSVSAGGGKIAPPIPSSCGPLVTSFVGSTSAAGTVGFCWTMGSTLGTNTVSATPSTGGDVPAGAVYTPASLSFNVEAIRIPDTTAPVIGEPVITGDLGTDDWYSSNVSVVWPVSDPESGIASSPGCTVTHSENTPTTGTELTCVATNGAGLSSRKSVTIKRDAERPKVSGSQSGNLGNGWYTTDVTITWVTSAGLSGINKRSPDCLVAKITEDGSFALTCTVTSKAGLSATAELSGKRDASTPIVVGVPNGTHGDDGWFTSDVNVIWNVSAGGPSGLGPLDGCGGRSVTTDQIVDFTCMATSGAGVQGGAKITVKRDATVPIVTGSKAGLLGTSPWFIGDVAITWGITAGLSGVGSKSPDCAIESVTKDGVFSYDCVVRSGAGLEGRANVSVSRDATVPVVTAALSGQQANGWYTDAVGILWTIKTGVSGEGSRTSPCAVTAVTIDGIFEGTSSFDCAVTSIAGLTGHGFAAFKRDATPPVVTYAGQFAAYTVADNVSITCTPTDAMSRVASSTCAPITGPAYTFKIGSNSGYATATDFAGNVGSGSVIFQVNVTFSSMCLLTKRFVTNAAIAGSMCSKLDAASRAAARGSQQAKAGSMNAYVNEINAQTGKSISLTNANLLIGLASHL